MKMLIAVLLFLGALTANAADNYPFFPSYPSMGGVSANTENGVENAVVAGADRTCTRDSKAAIQTAIDKLYSRATAANDNYQTGAVIVPSGCYRMDSGIQLYPSIKLMSAGGPVRFMFDQAPSGTTAFSINAGATPFFNSTNARGQGSAHYGYAIDGNNGMIGIFGRTGDTASVGISIGNVSDSVVVERDTRAGVRGVYISEFGTNLLFQPYDTYLNKFEYVYSRNPATAHISFVATADGTTDNSGEMMGFDRIVISGGQSEGVHAIVLNTQARNMYFTNSSFDYVKGSVVHLTEQGGFGGYGAVDIRNSHIENVTAWLTSAETQPYFMNVSFRDIYYVPGKTKNDFVTSNMWDRPIINAPNIKVMIDNVRIGQVSGTNSGVNGLFFATSNTIIAGAANIDMQNQRVLMSERIVPNYNWNFANSAVGNFQFGATTGWTVKNQTAGLGADIEVSASVPQLGSSLNRLKLTPSGGSFIDLVTEAFPVEQNNRLYGWLVMNGGESTSNLSYTQQYIFTRPMQKPTLTVTNVAKTGNNLTLTVNTPHQIESNTLVYFGNSNDPNYVGRGFVAFSVTDNTVRLQVPSAWAAPTPFMSLALTLRPEQVTIVSQSTTATSDISATYGNPANGAYTGNRRYWIQGDMNKTVNISNDLRVPYGATSARALLSVSVSGTSPVWIGGLPLQLIP